jgi:hypothetical protein
MNSIYQSYLKNKNTALTEAEIKAIENDLGFHIPIQLRNYYLFSNGGDFFRTQFDASEVCGEGTWGVFELNTMVAIYETAENNFDFFGEILELSNVLFPFSLTFNNKKLFIAHSGENTGKIYISEEKDEDRNFIPVRLIADSFLKFLDMLE